MTMACFCLLALTMAAAGPDAPPDPADLLDKAVARHFAMLKYDVDVRTSTLTGDRVVPSHRVRIAVDEEARAFRTTTLSGDTAEVITDGEWIWVRTRRGVSQFPAEGPERRSYRRAIDAATGRFALLGRTALEPAWVKSETVRRGQRRIPCAVIRIRPTDPHSGNWTETLWIEPATGLIWRSVRVERLLPEQGIATGPGQVRGAAARGAPPLSLDTVRTMDFDWLHTEGDLPPDTFAKPPWAGKANPPR